MDRTGFTRGPATGWVVENEAFSVMDDDRSRSPKKILLGVLIMDCLFWAALFGVLAFRVMQ